MSKWRQRLAEKREDLRRNLERLCVELDAGDWDLAERLAKGERASLADADADLATVVGAVRHSANAVLSGQRPASKVVSTIDALCTKYGVDFVEPAELPALHRCGDAQGVRTANKHLLTLPATTAQPMALAQAEQGYVGTPIRAGRVYKEPTGKYQAFTVRGSSGNPGLFEEYWASETQIYDAVHGHISGLVSGTWKLKPPKYLARSDRDAMQEFCDYHTARFRQTRCMEGRARTLIQHAGSMIPIGFALFEPVLAKDAGGRWYLKRCGFREQASVDKWYTTERGDMLQGVEFRTSGDDAQTYTLQRTLDPLTNHVLWVGLNAFGSNWEGRPPTRPALHWVKMKRLIAQIAPLAAEKWGVPIGYIRTDPEYMKALVALGGQSLQIPDLKAAYEAFKDVRAVEGPVFQFADGVIADVAAPPGEMPGLIEWIQYCDQMISYTYSNEGNLLGMQYATGSYAQAEVKERRFLRSAPGYAWPIAEAFTCNVYGPLAEREFGEALVEPPELVYSPDPATDAGGWLNNARILFGPNLPVDQWPAPYQVVAHEKMGVDYYPEDEDEAPAAPAPDPDPVAPDLAAAE